MKKGKLTEDKILKKLDIPDFQHITPDKLARFTSMIPKMDPEVAKTALEQFPEFAQNAVNIMGYLKDSIDNAINGDDAETQQIFKLCDDMIKSLEKLREREDITFDERSLISNQIMEIVKIMQDTKSQNQKWKLALTGILATAAIAITSILASGLGAETSITTQHHEES